MSRPAKTAVDGRRRSLRNHRLTDEELLGRAAELVARGWAQEAPAQDRFGHSVAPWSERARRWSPVGALQRVWHENGGGPLEVFEVAYTALSLATGGRLEEWNAAPWRTKWHVLSAFTRARRSLPEAREQIGARD